MTQESPAPLATADGPAAPPHPAPSAPASPARPPAPPSGASLRRLASHGAISADALEAALGYLGVRPGPQEWAVFWRHVLTLCGGLFVANGIVFFFAWNWADMHHYTKFALIQGIVIACGLLALWRGLDTLAGRMALLSAGIVMGPLLAVYGQAYQTGADLWELFRVWTLLLIPLACAGRQAGLWFLTWLVGTLWGVLYLGRLNIFNALFIAQYPEFLLAQVLCLVSWEGAARRWSATQPWLVSRWLPRLVLFCALGSLTFSVCDLIFSIQDGYGFRHSYKTLFLPMSPTNFVIYIVSMAGGWFWYRKKNPDLFMLGCGVLSANAVLVAFLIRARFMIYSDISALLLWGLLIIGLSAASGKLLLSWQKELEQEEIAKSERRTEAPGFFASMRNTATWQDIWAHLRGFGLLAGDAPAPLAAPAKAPWYIQAMQAFGGWIASLLLMGFLALLIALSSGMSHNFEAPLLICGAIMLGIGTFALRAPGMTLRQFGFSSALAGTGAISIALGMLAHNSGTWPLLAALGAWVSYPFVRNVPFRLMAGVAGFFLLSLGLELSLWGHDLWAWDYGTGGTKPNASALMMARLIMGAWWGLLCLGLAWGWLNEKRWIIHRSKAYALVPLLHAAYITLLVWLTAALSMRYAHSRLFMGVFSSYDLGVAAGVGCVFLAYRLTAALPLVSPARLACLAAAALTLAGGWYLPGVSLALLGLALSRYTGNAVMLGGTGFFLFAYISYYYYNLSTTLLHKSLTLMGIGAALLLAGYILPKVLSAHSGKNLTATGGAHA